MLQHVQMWSSSSHHAGSLKDLKAIINVKRLSCITKYSESTVNYL